MNDQGDQPIHDVEQRLNSRCTWFAAHITTLVHVLTDASAWDDIVASLAILVKRTPSQQIAKGKECHKYLLGHRLCASSTILRRGTM